MSHLDHLSAQLSMEKKNLIELLKSLHDVMSDHAFITQVLEINDDITAMSADN